MSRKKEATVISLVGGIKYVVEGVRVYKNW